MEPGDALSFQKLKKLIVIRMQQSHPGIPSDISEWKGQTIVDFQDELSRNVNEHISEKWFYTHMKSSCHTLPRVDVLNFLSRYAGFKNWDDFKHNCRDDKKSRKFDISPNKYFVILPLLTILILIAFYFAYQYYATREYQFCFYDADTKEGISESIIEVYMLDYDGTEEHYLCDKDGCIDIVTDKSKVTLVVNAPYYHADTIERVLDKFSRKEKIMLQANYYTLMIQYFSKKNVDDWQERRQKLDDIISENALIYQVDADGETGVELFTKWEFINMITMPASSLSKMEILSTKYQDEKISILRFRQITEQE